MRIAVIGSRGQLGSELCRQAADAAIGLDRSQLDITRREAVERCLTALAPDAVINTAAYTWVDKAEQQPEMCQAVNATAVGHLADTCARLGCVLVHVSTDYVFAADRTRRTPYRETDPPCPQGVYAVSKLAGERNAATCPRHFIVRTSGLYGQREPGSSAGNFVDTMLRIGSGRNPLRVVDDQQCTPSFVPDIARAIRFLLSTAAYLPVEKGGQAPRIQESGRKSDRSAPSQSPFSMAAYGLYHVVNAGSTTWYDFAAEIFRRRGVSVELQRITTEQYGAPAPRPAYSVLDTSKFRSLGGPSLRPWQEALADYLSRLPASAE